MITPATERRGVLSRLIDGAGHHRFLVLLLTLLVVVAGVISLLRMPLDALPDLSDVQVIVYTEYPGQSPQGVEDQVTYPLTTALLSVPHAKTVRGFSFFGASFVYVIFDDGTDLYWARSRVLEYLNSAAGRLPAGVTPDPRRITQPAGLDDALRAGQNAGCGRSRIHRRLRADLAGDGRSGEAACLWHCAGDGYESHPRIEPRCGGAHAGNGRDRVHGAILSSWSSRPPEARRC